MMKAAHPAISSTWRGGIATGVVGVLAVMLLASASPAQAECDASEHALCEAEAQQDQAIDMAACGAFADDATHYARCLHQAVYRWARHVRGCARASDCERCSADVVAACLRISQSELVEDQLDCATFATNPVRQASCLANAQTRFSRRVGKCSRKLSCESGQSCCDGSCVDTQTDSNNCGACANTCGSGQGCHDGSCDTTTTTSTSSTTTTTCPESLSGVWRGTAEYFCPENCSYGTCWCYPVITERMAVVIAQEGQTLSGSIFYYDAPTSYDQSPITSLDHPLGDGGCPLVNSSTPLDDYMCSPYPGCCVYGLPLLSGSYDSSTCSVSFNDGDGDDCVYDFSGQVANDLLSGTYTASGCLNGDGEGDGVFAFSVTSDSSTTSSVTTTSTTTTTSSSSTTTSSTSTTSVPSSTSTTSVTLSTSTTSIA